MVASAARRTERALLWARTLPRLGLGNVASVALHRLGLRSGWYERRLPVAARPAEPLFGADAPALPAPAGASPQVVAEADALLRGEMTLFSHLRRQVGAPPDWFLDPLTGQQIPAPDRHWSHIADFGEAGDIKAVWEASRWDWALVFARAYRLTADLRYLEALNAWSADWVVRNPLNRGPNWKCGQETAIRLLTALLAASLLNQHECPTPALCRFVADHCSRIVPTRRYAEGQQNNHCISEAAGLYVGGAWLARAGARDASLRRYALRWEDLGRRLLQRHIPRLVSPDGSFSQHSANYHRLLLAVLCQAELWRRDLGLPSWSAKWTTRTREAVEWLYQMVDPHSGDSPNLGANDGARLFALSSEGYRDYRPAVQIASVLFCGRPAYPPGPWDESLAWLGVGTDGAPTGCPSRAVRCFVDGGYVTLHAKDDRAWALVRYPRFRTRPSHADLLHLDLWVRGVNLLRDGGSYSYATDDTMRGYLRSVSAHNTVQFDGHDQMPALGRFLYAAWPEAECAGPPSETEGSLSWMGSYTDFWGCRHRRTVTARCGGTWRVLDEIDGYRKRAVLRWRLAPGAWWLEGARCVGEWAAISVTVEGSTRDVRLVDGWESRRYLERTPLPVLEVEVGPAQAILATEITTQGA